MQKEFFRYFKIREVISQGTIKITMFLALLGCLFFSSIGQVKKNSILSVFRNADSIILVSHESLYVPSEPGKKANQSLSILKNGLPNYSIIHENRKLDKESINKLSNILTKKYSVEDYNQALCFVPHHAIFIFKKGYVSYFHLCFGCHRVKVSNDITLEQDGLSDRVWGNLENFFLTQNISYEMPVYNKIKAKPQQRND